MKPYQVKGDFQNARVLAKIGLSLPLNPFLEEEEVAYISDSVRNFFGKISS